MPNRVGNFAETMKLKSFDITTESRWLYDLLTNHLGIPIKKTFHQSYKQLNLPIN